jgi:hypothetical protein
MSINLNRLMDLWSVSTCFWIIYGLYTAIRIELFIVKRYEVETDLMDAIFFKEHATFTRSLPPFFSSALYTGHLSMVLWGWRIYRSKKAFRDIDNPSKVLKHFSTDELKRVRMYGISGTILILHVIGIYIFKYIQSVS